MSKFIHALVIERVAWDDANRDSEGQPQPGTPTTTDVMGLIQPRRTGGSASAEMDDWRSAGSEVSDHVIFIPDGVDVRNDDVIVFGVERYQVTGIRRFRYGQLAHLEVDSRLISAVPVTASAGS